MKLYTFVDSNDEIIEQVLAENHDDAVSKAQSSVDYFTDFYSENI